MDHRTLTTEEISLLCSQGCTAENWEHVLVCEPFDAARVRSVQFSGSVRLGLLDDQAGMDSGVESAGVYRSHLHDTTIGNNCRICGVGLIAGYNIGDRCVVERTHSVAMHGSSSFGNGAMVAVVNEGGGRTVPLCQDLTAQSAYVAAMYRHDAVLTDRLLALLRERAARANASRGSVGTGTRIQDCGRLRNVVVGEYADIVGAQRLDDGTVLSSQSSRAHIGDGVIAEHFVVQEGGRLDSGAIVSRSLVGQGAVVSKGFVADDCLVFANGDFSCGEACSVFAGPHAVSHHRSTLLVACLLSFFNAGSGTNQSNHKYKLGPLHQGILARGAKTGSSSYLPWPSKVGAYSVVIGRHPNSINVADLPFSLMVGHDTHTQAMPGTVLLGCGLHRDARKWANRDRRHPQEQRDIVNGAVMSPLTGDAIRRAMVLLEGLAARKPSARDYVVSGGVRIKARALESYRRYYALALDRYLGELVAARLATVPQDASPDDIRAHLRPDGEVGAGEWVDIAGWLAPAVVVDSVLQELRDGGIDTLEALHRRMTALHGHYGNHVWVWCVKTAGDVWDMDLSGTQTPDLATVACRYRDSASELLAMAEMDMAREFDDASMVGYGVDGGEQRRAADFAAVRGEPDQHPFASWLAAERERVRGETEHLEALAGRVQS